MLKYNKKSTIKSFLWFFLKFFLGPLFIIFLILFIKLKDFEARKPLRLTQLNYYFKNFLNNRTVEREKIKLEKKRKTLKINKQNIPENKR